MMGFLLLVLLVPAAMLSSTIRERERRREGAVQDISSKWGFAQTLGGPWLVIPYRTWVTDEKGKVFAQIHHAYFLPEALEIVGDIGTEIRYRGIYEAVL